MLPISLFLFKCHHGMRSTASKQGEDHYKDKLWNDPENVKTFVHVCVCSRVCVCVCFRLSLRVCSCDREREGASE